MLKKTTEQFIEEAKNIHGDKYDYSLTKYIGSASKLEIICPKHGIFEQTPANHLWGKGCRKCAYENRIKPFDEFVKDVNIIHKNKYTYCRSSYENRNSKKSKIKITCPDHGIFEQTSDSHSRGKGCSQCAGNAKKSTDLFIQESKKIFGDKYIYLKTKYKNNVRKVIITCKDHGDFKINPLQHIQQKNGCRECARIERFNKFLRISNDVHENFYDYSMVEYKTKKDKVSIICPNHGSFEQEAQSHQGGAGCSKCKQSSGEKKIEKYLNSIGAEFETEYSFKECKNILPLPFDFYLGNLLIEYQGEQHYKAIEIFGGEEQLKQQQKNDQIKRDFCKKNGFKLLEIKYDDNHWREKIEEQIFTYLI